MKGIQWVDPLKCILMYLRINANFNFNFSISA